MHSLELIQKTKLYTKAASHDAIVLTASLAEQILNEIIALLTPGISESQATLASHEIFKKHGIQKLWHRPIIRFNQHTLCTFKDRPTNNYILQEEDIAFVDIGIVKDGIEGDAGKTITFGHHPTFTHLKNTSEILFHDAISYWKKYQPTGIQLYEFIHHECKKHRVSFNLSPAGHLIGTHPHTHAWTKGADCYPETLAKNAWILEIQIKSLTQPFGAFYEGLMT